jgi:hypothetical protein
VTLKQKLAQKIEQNQHVAIDTIAQDHEVTKTEEVLAMGEGNIVHFRGQSNSIQVVPELQISIGEAKQRIEMLQQFVKEMMVPGIDFGLIPSCSNKPTLFKAGAEKLTDVYGFSKQLEIVNRVEDWEKGFFHYEVKVTLVSKRNGHIEAEGIGSCNSKEKKYKSMDSFSIVNTILKMAKKRAIVDAVLSATRSSGLFTQDIEDFASEPQVENKIHIQNTVGCRSDFTAPRNEPFRGFETTSPFASTTPVYSNTVEAPRDKSATVRQLNLIYSLVDKKGIGNQKAAMLLREKFGVNESRELTSKQASELIQYLIDMQ